MRGRKGVSKKSVSSTRGRASREKDIGNEREKEREEGRERVYVQYVRSQSRANCFAHGNRLPIMDQRKGNLVDYCRLHIVSILSIIFLANSSIKTMVPSQFKQKMKEDDNVRSKVCL